MPVDLATDGRDPVWRVAVVTGSAAAAAGATLAVCATMLCWLCDPTGNAWVAIKAGMLAFLAAQHGGVSIEGVPVHFLPLGMVAAVLVIGWRAGIRLAEHVADTRWSDTLPVLGLQAATYASICAVLVPVASVGSSNAPLVGATVAAFGMLFVSSGAAVCWAREVPVPRIVTSAVRAGFAGALVYLAAGSLLVAASLLFHARTAMDLSHAVGGGLSGIPILMLGVLAAPNAVVAGAGYLTGAGFHVGGATEISPFGSTFAEVPAFPVLGALPAGEHPWKLVFVLMAATALTAGGVVARLAWRSGGFRTAMAVALGGAVTAGALTALLAWQGGGALGGEALATMGVPPVRAGLTVAAAIGAVGVVTIPVCSAWQWLANIAERRLAAAPAPVAVVPDVEEPAEPDVDDGEALEALLTLDPVTEKAS